MGKRKVKKSSTESGPKNRNSYFGIFRVTSLCLEAATEGSREHDQEVEMHKFR
jgi:hypothetical protein